MPNGSANIVERGHPGVAFLVVQGEGGRLDTGHASLMIFDFTRSPPWQGCGGYFLMKKRSLGAKGSIEKLTLVDF